MPSPRIPATCSGAGSCRRARARAVADRLLEDDLFSGWGIRTLSTRMRGYNPLEYHGGTVWPHDSVICAEGMRRYGFREHAGRVGRAILAAAVGFEHRLPELFAGFTRDAAGSPSPTATRSPRRPWAAAAPLLVLRTLLGLDVVDGRLRSRPRVPRELGRIRLKRIPVRGRLASA